VLGVPVMQAVDPAPGLVLRDGLVGVGLGELAEVLAELALVDAPA
jgi:hypothetical protein